MKSIFIRAFKEVLREQISDKNSVELEGLGNFKVVHKKQHQQKLKDGEVVVMPPSDVIEFKSEVRSGSVHENK